MLHSITATEAQEMKEGRREGEGGEEKKQVVRGNPICQGVPT